jgi:hypothetical protein
MLVLPAAAASGRAARAARRPQERGGQQCGRGFVAERRAGDLALVGVFAAASARSGAAIGGHELIVRCVPITFDDRPAVASERQPATELSWPPLLYCPPQQTTPTPYWAPTYWAFSN